MPEDEAEEASMQTAEKTASIQDTPETLVLKGICIVPVFCIRCRKQLLAKKARAGALLCPRCIDALQPDEGLIDVGFYCTVCGKQKEPHIVAEQRKVVAGRTLYMLCWEYCFVYTREHSRDREAKRLALQNALAICMVQGYSMEECKILRDALNAL